MKNKRFLSLAVASALGLLSPLSAEAFGLGKLELHSALNEPLRAEIPVTSLRADEADNVEVRLASKAEFEKAGLEKTFVLTDLKFNIVRDTTGVKIEITSNKAVKEPLLDFLLTATTGEGRLIREYTVLLDPPKHVLAKPESKISTKTTSKQIPQASTSKSNKTSYQYDNAGSTSKYTDSEYGPTDKTDTLWNIALKTRPDNSFSVNQMMMALLNENTDAFNRQNINGLKAGRTLTIPTADAIKRLSKSEAIAAVTEQNSLWKNRNKIVPQVGAVVEKEQPVLAEHDVVTESKSSLEEAAAEVAGVGLSVENDSARLKLVSPKTEELLGNEVSSLDGNEKIEQLSEQLTFAQETIEAQAQENIDFKSRMDVMEEQLETMRRLISLKDADMARLQSLLEKEQAAQSATGSSQLAKPEMNDELEPEKIEGLFDNIDLPSVDHTMSSTSQSIDLDEAEVKGVINKVQQFIEQNKLTTMLVGLLFLLALWLIIRRRKPTGVTWEQAVRKIDDNPEIRVVADEQEDVSVKTDSSQSITEVKKKSFDELVSQADMFVGYADYAQARTSLEQAQLLDPDNQTVISKLLFVLYKQQQTDNFINLLEDAQIDLILPEWQEVAKWGRALAPDHALFNIETVPAVDDRADIKQKDELVAEDTQANSDELVLSPEDLNELENVKIEAPEVAMQSESSPLEFNLNDIKAGVPEVELDISSTEAVSADISEEGVEIESPVDNADSSDLQTEVIDKLLTPDINHADTFTQDENKLSIDELDESTPLAEESFTLDVDTNEEADRNLDAELSVSDQDLEVAINELSGDEAPDLEFDIDNFDEIDEAETKLDLAAAYIDMGDPSGAKSILEEVMAEGNDDQKLRAQNLLNDLIQ